MVGEKFDFLNLHRLRGMSSPCNWWQHDKLILCFFTPLQPVTLSVTEP